MMIAPDDTNEYPPWILPYINPAVRLTKQNPVSDSWRMAVHGLVQAAQAKALVKRLPEGQQKAATRSAESTIAMLIEDWCGTPPRRWPWPFPGPPPWAYQIASEISFLAETLQPGTLRDELNNITGQVLSGGQRGLER
jgi:hypothetical protein